MCKGLIKMMLLLCVGATNIQAKVLDLTGKPIIRLTGVVDKSILSKMRVLNKIKGKKVVLLINSPGGDVYPGLQFIDAMEAVKTRGVKITCVVSNMAASMAFQILSKCDSRYSLANSLLLWHPMKLRVS